MDYADSPLDLRLGRIASAAFTYGHERRLRRCGRGPIRSTGCFADTGRAAKVRRSGFLKLPSQTLLMVFAQLPPFPPGQIYRHRPEQVQAGLRLCLFGEPINRGRPKSFEISNCVGSSFTEPSDARGAVDFGAAAQGQQSNRFQFRPRAGILWKLEAKFAEMGNAEGQSIKKVSGK